MTPALLAQALRAFNRRRPFRPFCIEFNSGNRLLVSHPEVVNQRGDLFIYLSPYSGYRIFHASGVCQLLDPPPGPPST